MSQTQSLPITPASWSLRMNISLWSTCYPTTISIPKSSKHKHYSIPSDCQLSPRDLPHTNSALLCAIHPALLWAALLDAQHPCLQRHHTWQPADNWDPEGRGGHLGPAKGCGSFSEPTAMEDTCHSDQWGDRYPMGPGLLWLAAQRLVPKEGHLRPSWAACMIASSTDWNPGDPRRREIGVGATRIRVLRPGLKAWAKWNKS